MADRSRDAAFAQFASEQRAVLLGTAYLMFAGQDQPEDLVQHVLANLYVRWSATPDPREVALSELLHTQPGRLGMPWQRGERVELLDGFTDRPPLPQGIVADLADLDGDSRRVVILAQFVQLPSEQIAAVVGCDLAQVHTLARTATVNLAGQDQVRHVEGQLAEQMRAAVQPELRASGPTGGAVDLAHGRFLVRRRVLRRSLVVATILVAFVLALFQLTPLLQPQRDQASAAPPVQPRPSPTCDPSDPGCRDGLVGSWRREMARVTTSYVDPGRNYYSGYTYSSDDRYDSADFWRGDGGVLGLDLWRTGGGATEVYVQLATSKEFALPCGQTTHQNCVVMRFMDGNVLTMTDTTWVTQGLEVQYSPAGTEVITVVAKNRSGGKKLDITRGQLISLVEDARLRLPQL